MFEILSIGATGMQAQDAHLRVIADNLANVNTSGFKKGRVGFSDLLVQAAGQQASPDRSSAPGAGVAVSTLAKSFEPGELRKTGNSLDIAIEGDGFLEVTLEDGSTAFTRGGSLKVNADGLLATAAGHPLKAAIAVPDKLEAIVIGRDGVVHGRVAGQAGPIELGQMELVRFASPSLLTALGDNLYRASAASGDPVAFRPGVDGAATLAQGVIEMSNVKMVDEMVNLIMAQRAYEASVKVVQAADEMLGLVNNLRK